MIFRYLIVLFPACHLSMIAASLWWFVITPTIVSAVMVLFSVYFFPIVAFKIQNAIVPLKEGKFDFSERRYCPWWGAHQIQQVYAAIPHLEGILRVLPGAYSAWLRLWGAKIGKGVYWTPRIEVVDRMLLEIGDGSVFGHRAACSSHIITLNDRKLMLQVNKIRMGKKVLLGAGSRLGPGATIADYINIPICTILLIDQHVKTQDQIKNTHHDPIPRPTDTAAA